MNMNHTHVARSAKLEVCVGLNPNNTFAILM